VLRCTGFAWSSKAVKIIGAAKKSFAVAQMDGETKEEEKVEKE
jgi:hypothetical protein